MYSIQNKTYLYYNTLFVKYIRTKYKFYDNINNNNIDKILHIIKQIEYIGNKEDIDSYYKIYNKYINNNYKTFIDLGCAPGGFLKFARKYNFIGYGVTLPEKDKTGLIIKDKYNYKIIYGNIIDSENIIKQIKINNVDFINLGAISYNNDIKNNELLLHQFKITKMFLKKGGDILLIVSVFKYIYFFVDIVNIFIKHNIHIKCIPIQPNFKTEQIYLYCINIQFTDQLFNDLTNILTIKYIPLISENMYKQKINKIFTSKYFDINSFIECYYIKICYNVEKKCNLNNLKLEQIKISSEEIDNINERYLTYENIKYDKDKLSDIIDNIYMNMYI